VNSEQSAVSSEQKRGVSRGQEGMVVKCIIFLVIVVVFTPFVQGGQLTEIELVRGGKAKACIEVPQDAPASLLMAVDELSLFIRKKTGACIELCQEDGAGELVRIHLGPTDRVRSILTEIQDMPDDGFVIRFPDEHTITIFGPTDQGTLFGVYDFLERYLGVRWIFPGPLGEDVPLSPDLKVPAVPVNGKPVFFSRQMSGFPNKVQKTWARRMRLKGHIAFQHNMNRIIPPETYTRTHPYFFPVINGRRFLPPDNHTQGWQPCFTADGIVEAAARSIIEYFKTHPEKSSFSLGINDFGGFCEEDLPVSKEKAQRNFVGYVDLSDIYFSWANAVVEKVLEKYPDRWFGSLAYDYLLEPPRNLPVHPRIIPFMTYDRMKWIHRQTEQAGKRITRAWAARTARLGWYDYIYGSPYHVPRIYFHKMAEYYRFAAESGVSAVYAEASPNWGEGPKLYVAARLMWNPYLNVDAVLEEWYLRAVGQQAAPLLASYFKLWEKFWTQRILKTDWFTPRGQFLHFWLPEYLELVTFKDLKESRRLLEAVVEKAGGEVHRLRAEMLLRAFEYYEASALSYLGLVLGRRQPGKTIAYYRNMHRRRKTLVDAFENDPVLVHPVRFDRKFSWAPIHPFNRIGRSEQVTLSVE